MIRLKHLAMRAAAYVIAGLMGAAVLAMIAGLWWLDHVRFVR